ncbi:MAG: glyoxalase [Alphaproteobacteria bacterium]|nr:glyoxalase [Alphaproteobacteria bacterium]
MITGLDHVALDVPDPARAATDLGLLLGRRFDGNRVRLANLGIELRASPGPAGLSLLAFATDTPDQAARLLERRGLSPGLTQERIALPVEKTHGVVMALGRGTGESPSPLLDSDDAAAIVGLDHVVVRTPDPDRAVALYAGRLGLDLRLDRSNPDWGARLLFFRCGDLVVEVAHDLKKGRGDGPDRLWGLSWRASDIKRVHARLGASGIATSEIRTGRRPGTEVFTVRSHTADVPTIMIGGLGRW